MELFPVEARPEAPFLFRGFLEYPAAEDFIRPGSGHRQLLHVNVFAAAD